MGDDILLSWGVLIMDSDSHMIYGLDGTIINDDKEIVLGKNFGWDVIVKF